MKPSVIIAGGLVVLVAGFVAGAYWQHRARTASPDNPIEMASPAGKATRGEGRFYPFAGSGAAAAVAGEAAEQLGALGYLSGYVEASDTAGVTIHDPEASYGSLNVYTSGHAPEAYLMDMNGTVLHEWRYAFEQLWPDYDGPEVNTRYWRRAHVFENGDVLALIEPLVLFKLDADSNLIWSNRCRAHHDVAVLEDGTIYTLVQNIRPVLWHSREGAVMDDAIAVLTPDGEVVREISLMECLRNSPYRAALKGAKPAGDVLHTNALKYLDGRHADRHPAFRRGNVLVSMREIDLVAVVDLDAESVVWAISGMWHRQHEPTLVDEGGLLVFDNLGNGEKSKVIELDPLTRKVLWVYGQAKNEPLYSKNCGTAARLPNGNTLIVESNNGRAIEVTPDKRIAWEFVNPHRAGDRNELIATILDLKRLPTGFSPQWLEEIGGGARSGRQ